MKFRAIISLLDRRIIPFLVVIFFLSAGTAKANSMIYYTQSYAPFQVMSADLLTPATPKVIYSSGSGSPYAVAVDATNSRIYFSDPNPTVAKIYSAPLNGNAGEYTPFIANVSAEGIAVDPTHGYIYYAQPGSGSVVRANLTDGLGRQTVYTSGGAPRAIAVDPVGGYIYIADYNLAKIIRANLDGSNPVDLITNVHAKGLGIDTTHGKIYYSDAYNPRFNLVRANLTVGSGQEILYSSLTGSPGAIAVDPVNGYIYFSDWHSTVAKIFRANLDGSNRVGIINNVNSYGIGLYLEQTIFTISGTITDFQGGLQGATVDAGNGNTATTDASGNFSLSLPNGIYTLTVSKNGYQSSNLSVAVSGGNKTGQNLTLFKIAAVTGISPSSGPESGDTTVTISGTGFTGATAVNFGTAAGTNLIVKSDTLITVTSPGGTGTVDVTVTTPGGTTTTDSSDKFTYTSTYTVSIGSLTGGSITASPTSAALGDTISLTVKSDAGMRLQAGTLKYNDGITDHAIDGTNFTMPAANVTVTAVFEQIPTLTEAITNATNLLASKTIGTAEGNVSQEAHDAYNSAITSATIVKDNAAATQAEVDAAVTALATATTTFNNAIVQKNSIIGFTVRRQVGSSTINSTSHTVTFHMSYGTSIKSLTPTITVSTGATISPASKVAKNFSGQVSYTVKAKDGTSQTTWTVTCIVDPNDGNDITGFTVPLQVGSSTIDTASHTVTFHMPYGTSVTSLVPTITLSTGATISPASGIAQEFTNPLVYSVTAENQTSQAWTVTCINDPNRANNIIDFTVPAQVGTSTINTTSHTVTFHMPYGTSVKSLAPTLSVSQEATVSPLSGETQNFTRPITYTVTAQNRLKQAWKVSCIVDPNTANDITGLTLSNQIGNATIDSTNHTVTFHMLYDTNVKRLAPIITLSEKATINPGSRSTQNFSNPVIYTVKAQNKTPQAWKVTCIVDPISRENDITGFTVLKQIGSSTIDLVTHTVTFHMASGTSVKALTPTITVSAGATISPASKRAQNFANEITYKVTAQDASIQEWRAICVVDLKP